jgi:GAF domain-containing protein
VLLTKNLPKKQVKEINLDDNVVGYAVQKGEIIISGNGRSKKHKVPGIVAHPSKIKTFICLPLKSKDKVVGVLFIGDFEEIRFTQKDQDLLKSIGNTIGVSIENAMLFEEIKAANLEIEQEREKLEHLTKKLIVSQEDERRIISRELHDEAGQLLSTLKINLEMIKKNLPGNLKDISTLIK